MYTESPPLNDEYPENDVDASDRGAERASSSRGHRLRPGTSYRSSGFKNAQFASDRLSSSRRIFRALARFSIAMLIGVGATLVGSPTVARW
jgi:hypothetical protein